MRSTGRRDAMTVTTAIANQQDGVDLSVASGTDCALLGPNGAGKTTLVKQVIGLLAPTTGTITVDGHDVVADVAAARRLCSFQPQAQMSLDGLTPRTGIELVGRLRGAPRSAVRERTESLIAAPDLAEWADRDGARLSGGMKRITGFAMAAVVPGRVVLLDEPTNDVDPIRRRLLWNQVRALADEGSAVLVVTHNLDEIESIADRFVMMNHGWGRSAHRSHRPCRHGALPGRTRVCSSSMESSAVRGSGT